MRNKTKFKLKIFLTEGGTLYLYFTNNLNSTVHILFIDKYKIYYYIFETFHLCELGMLNLIIRHE